MLRSRIAAITAAALLLTGFASAAQAAGTQPAGNKKVPASTIAWTGNGTEVVDGLRLPKTMVCDAEVAPTGYEGAPVTGEHLIFVLAATKALTNPTLSVAGTTLTAYKSNVDKKGNSSYKFLYTSEDALDLDALLGDALNRPVVASFTGSATPTLTVGQGCVDVITYGYSFLTGWYQDILGSIAEGCSDPATRTGCNEAVTRVVATANGKDQIHAFAVDLYTDVFDYTTFDYAKISAVGLYKSDGTKLADMGWLDCGEGMCAFSEVDIYNFADLAPDTSDITIMSYIQITYDGVNYKFYVQAYTD